MINQRLVQRICAGNNPFYSASATTIDELGGKDFGLFGTIEVTK